MAGEKGSTKSSIPLYRDAPSPTPSLPSSMLSTSLHCTTTHGLRTKCRKVLWSELSVLLHQRDLRACLHVIPPLLSSHCSIFPTWTPFPNLSVRFPKHLFWTMFSQSSLIYTTFFPITPSLACPNGNLGLL